MTRQVPRWSELRPLVRVRRQHLNAADRRLSRAFTIADLRRIGRRRVPRAVFDYTDGAADSEAGLQRARRAWRSLEFEPRVLRDVSAPDISSMVLGRRARSPLILAPTGFTRLMHHEGERAVARSARRHGLVYALSTLGTTTIEDVAGAAPGARHWFQLYVSRDRAVSEELMSRAANAGFEALVLTVDVPVAGQRVRDLRNGFSIPPALGARTIADLSLSPGWWLNLLTTEPLVFATLSQWEGTVGELLDRMFDPAVTWADLEWIRSRWSRGLIIKGVQSVADARRAADAGADAVVLSNHGGRQLDRAVPPLRLLSDVVEVVGDRAEVHVDTGVMSGQDVIGAVALGARAVWVGRAYLYGLMAGGEKGVDRALEILDAEMRRSMALLGAQTVDELGPDLVRLPPG